MKTFLLSVVIALCLAVFVRSGEAHGYELSVLGQITEIREELNAHCPEMVIDVTQDNYQMITSIIMGDIVCSNMSAITAVGSYQQLMRLNRILEAITTDTQL